MLTFWHWLHVLSLFLFVAGVGAVVAPIYRGWFSRDLRTQMISFTQAANNESALLLPGALAAGVTGVFWGAAAGYNFITTGWLVGLWASYLLAVFICMPLMGLGLRRVRLLTLQAQKRNKITPELEAALADNVPIVFATIIAILTVLMASFAIWKPF